MVFLYFFPSSPPKLSKHYIKTNLYPRVWCAKIDEDKEKKKAERRPLRPPNIYIHHKMEDAKSGCGENLCTQLNLSTAVSTLPKKQRKKTVSTLPNQKRRMSYNDALILLG